MMQGKNTMELNEATMKKVVQHYFDTVLFAEGKSPVVTNVKGNNYGFTVEVEGEAA